jgi:hypothetical protein
LEFSGEPPCLARQLQRLLGHITVLKLAAPTATRAFCFKGDFLVFFELSNLLSPEHILVTGGAEKIQQNRLL